MIPAEGAGTGNDMGWHGEKVPLRNTGVTKPNHSLQHPQLLLVCTALAPSGQRKAETALICISALKAG